MWDTTFARQTIFDHTAHSIQDGKVIREQVEHPGRGRPSFTNRVPRAVTRVASPLIPTDIVGLTFLKLRYACRFEKGGWCMEVKKQCAPENCPLIIRRDYS